MRPSTAKVSQATGRRTVLCLRCARLLTNSLVMGGFPQPVSQVVVLSSVLPMLVPGVMSGTAAQASRSVIFSTAGGAALVPPLAPDEFKGGGRRQASGTAANRRTASRGRTRLALSLGFSFTFASGLRWCCREDRPI